MQIAFKLSSIKNAKIGPNRTFEMILLSHQTQIDLLISSWLTFCHLD